MFSFCVMACAGAGGIVADDLTLRQVVDTALESSIDVRLARSQVRSGEGNLLAARSLYDPVFNASGSRSTSADPVLSGSAGGTDATSTFSTSYSRRLLSGLRLIPSIDVTQLDADGSSAISTGTVNLQVIAPLLEDRGGKSNRLLLRAAEQAHEGDRWSLTHQRSLSVFTAAAAYWSYLAAVENLEVFRASQQRAELLVGDMEKLVENEERPAADLIQLEGNASSKRIDRNSAEQALIVARRQLGLAMGISGTAIDALRLPADDFPQTTPFTANSATIEQLVDLAVERRADLEAQGRQQESARMSFEAAEDTLKPSLDLSVSAGYSGIDSGGGVDPFLGSLASNISGLSTSVILSYQLPIRNDAAHGSTLRSQAVLEQQEILTQDLERRVRSAVRVSAEALERAGLRAQEAELAVSLNRTTVDNEKKKNQLGMATLFDVILAEDRLTGVLLNQVSARHAYALALASLRFETGSLTSHSDVTPPVVDATSLTFPPTPEELAGSRPAGEGNSPGGAGRHQEARPR